jgi:hypothetical protein
MLYRSGAKGSSSKNVEMVEARIVESMGVVSRRGREAETREVWCDDVVLGREDGGQVAVLVG